MFHAHLLHGRLLHAGRGGGFGCRFATMLRLRFVCLSLALHFQPVLFQLLRVERLLRTMLWLRMFRPALATVRAITPVGATTAAAAATAPPAL